MAKKNKPEPAAKPEPVEVEPVAAEPEPVAEPSPAETEPEPKVEPTPEPPKSANAKPGDVVIYVGRNAYGQDEDRVAIVTGVKGDGANLYVLPPDDEPFRLVSIKEGVKAGTWRKK